MAFSLTLLSVRPGGGHGGALEAMVADYLKRCGKAFPASSRVFKTEALLLEAVRLEAGKGAVQVWLADLGGRALTTEQFAERVGGLRDGGVRQLMMAIGPADGWSDAARQLADLRLSLSAMTLPHELARLVLAEQMYRAVTILQGHPYHGGH